MSENETLEEKLNQLEKENELLRKQLDPSGQSKAVKRLKNEMEIYKRMAEGAVGLAEAKIATMEQEHKKEIAKLKANHKEMVVQFMKKIEEMKKP
jgi:hypothetical protein